MSAGSDEVVDWDDFVAGSIERDLRSDSLLVIVTVAVIPFQKTAKGMRAPLAREPRCNGFARQEGRATVARRPASSDVKNGGLEFK